MALDPRVNSSSPQSVGYGAAVDYWQPGDRTLPANFTVPPADEQIFNPIYDIEQESSIAAAIYASSKIYAESDKWGTPAMRIAVVGQSGEIEGSRYKWRIPLAVDVALKLQKYMGSPDGKWKEEYAPDLSGNNIVSFLTNVNVTFKPSYVYDRDWLNGLIWVQYKDRRSLFYPALQTIYPDDTSVLNSLINSKAAATMDVVCHSTWTDLVGNGKYTKEQFLERSDEMIRERSSDIFGNRFKIVPKTFYTKADNARGYSWSCEVDLYMNNMKLVGSYTIVAKRLEDYQGS